MNRSTMLRATLCILGLNCLLIVDAKCASIKPECDGDGGCYIEFDGTIERGDADKLSRVLGRDLGATRFWAGISLNSPGGDVEEAFKIAQLVKAAAIATDTEESPSAYFNAIHLEGGRTAHFYTCASACFIIAVAGSSRRPRIDKGEGRIGIHRPFFDASFYRNSAITDIQNRQNQAMSKMRSFLAAEGVSTRLIDEMMIRPSTDIHWLTLQEYEREVGFESPWWEELTNATCPTVPKDPPDPRDIGAATKARWACKEKLMRSAQADLRKKLAAAK
jgi:hypothetical protein